MLGEKIKICMFLVCLCILFLPKISSSAEKQTEFNIMPFFFIFSNDIWYMKNLSIAELQENDAYINMIHKYLFSIETYDFKIMVELKYLYKNEFHDRYEGFAVYADENDCFVDWVLDKDYQKRVIDRDTCDDLYENLKNLDSMGREKVIDSRVIHSYCDDLFVNINVKNTKIQYKNTCIGNIHELQLECPNLVKCNINSLCYKYREKEPNFFSENAYAAFDACSVDYNFHCMVVTCEDENDQKLTECKKDNNNVVEIQNSSFECKYRKEIFQIVRNISKVVYPE